MPLPKKTQREMEFLKDTREQLFALPTSLALKEFEHIPEQSLEKHIPTDYRDIFDEISSNTDCHLYWVNFWVENPEEGDHILGLLKDIIRKSWNVDLQLKETVWIDEIAMKAYKEDIRDEADGKL
jgi:hypothetical protein